MCRPLKIRELKFQKSRLFDTPYLFAKTRAGQSHEKTCHDLPMLNKRKKEGNGGWVGGNREALVRND